MAAMYTYMGATEVGHPTMQVAWGPAWGYEGAVYAGGMAWYPVDGQQQLLQQPQQQQQQQHQQEQQEPPSGEGESSGAGGKEAAGPDDEGEDRSGWPTPQQGRNVDTGKRRGKAGKGRGGGGGGDSGGEKGGFEKGGFEKGGFEKGGFEKGERGGKGKGSGKGYGGQNRGRRRSQQEGSWGGESWEQSSSSGGRYGHDYPGAPRGFGVRDFLGTWTDSLGNIIDVSHAGGGDRRGPLSARLCRNGREQVLSLRRDATTGIWACGNAVMDINASTPACVVWTAFDGRRSVWCRQQEEVEEEQNSADPPDLLPWLLTPAAQAARDGAPLELGTGPRMKSWTSARDDLAQATAEAEAEAAAAAEADAEALGAGAEPEVPEEEEPTGEKEEEETPPSSPPSEAVLDAARVAAVLDSRQVLGGDRASQDALSALLTDHDLARGDEEDSMVPSLGSPLWERLALGPRRNALQRLTKFSLASAASHPAAAFTSETMDEVYVGRHRFVVEKADVKALIRRWTGSEEEPGALERRSAEMAHVLALYRALESPLSTDGRRSMLQLSWMPRDMKEAGVEYELFASPFNAQVANGRYGSRWPHVEASFGSAGAYPSVIDMFPEGANVCVNPPFTDGYLEHLMGGTLDRILARFGKVHLFVPVREAPWRPRLRQLQGASFVRELWDATALSSKNVAQPVLYWQGSSLSDA